MELRLLAHNLLEQGRDDLLGGARMQWICEGRDAEAYPGLHRESRLCFCHNRSS